MNTFIDYVMSFYGSNGIYDIKATRDEVTKATNILQIIKGTEFEGDSIDREQVRDIILQMRGN